MDGGWSTDLLRANSRGQSQHKSLDIIQLFHKAGSPASTKVANLLKQVSAAASESATEDQASDHSAQSANRRDVFELQISEEAPTADQLTTILDYAGPSGVSSIVKGASTTSEALRLYKQNVDNLKRPVVRFFLLPRSRRTRR